ncbi:MAG: hypothetical protein K2X29_10345 [Candidatus Obscuribacterales bacterium]|jgi:hypothetical protein|nr:hypothetical protein [Candidatus Obscuribacterales bacterium]
MTLHRMMESLHNIAASKGMSAESQEAARQATYFLTYFVPHAKLDWNGDASQLWEKAKEMLHKYLDDKATGEQQ